MTMAAEFRRKAVQFALRHPAAVLDMAEPELAIDPRARTKHLRRTCESVRQDMRTTARLALRPSASSPTPDLFEAAPQRPHA